MSPKYVYDHYNNVVLGGGGGWQPPFSKYFSCARNEVLYCIVSFNPSGHLISHHFTREETKA